MECKYSVIGVCGDRGQRSVATADASKIEFPLERFGEQPQEMSILVVPQFWWEKISLAFFLTVGGTEHGLAKPVPEFKDKRRGDPL